MKNTIKLFEPHFDKKEEKSVLKTLRSGFWANGAGEGQVKQFEEKFNEYIGSKYCVAVNSGTAALHLALSLYDIKNKEVILPSLSFVSTAHAILLNGGIPKFADLDANTLCMDPNSVENLITDKTKIILPVHFAGMSSDLKKLSYLSKKYNLKIVEDAAHAAGTVYNNKKIGTHSSAVCFSFHPVKNLAMPTGGAITLNNFGQKIVHLLKSRRWCGITNRRNVFYDVKEIGWNYYMNELSASVGIQQLKKLDSMNAKRKKIAKKYFKEINLNQKMPYDENCSYHIYWICVNNRKNFMKKMFDAKIETGIHYKPIIKMSLYKEKLKSRFPITSSIMNNIVSIPIHPKLSENEIDYIINSVNKFQ